MNVRPTLDDGAVRLEVKEKALLDAPRWSDILPDDDLPPLVVLDLTAVEFISAVFLESCVALDRRLAGQGRRLALLGTDEVHRVLLAQTDGGARLATFDDAQAVAAWARDLAPGTAPGRPGLQSAERGVLWS